MSAPFTVLPAVLAIDIAGTGATAHINLAELPPDQLASVQRAYASLLSAPGTTQLSPERLQEITSRLPPDLARAAAAPAQIRTFVSDPTPPPPDPMPPKKTKSKGATTAYDMDDSDGEMPPLEPLPSKPSTTPKPVPSTSTSSPSKKPAAASKPTGSLDDGMDSDDSMPPLTSVDGANAAPPPPLREPAFGRGKTESKLFDFEGFEPVEDDEERRKEKKGQEKGVRAAYRLLGWKESMGDKEVVKKAEEIMAGEVCRTLPLSSLYGADPRSLAQRSSDRSGKSTSPRLGAVLTIVASRTSLHNFNALGKSDERSLYRVLRTLYLSEAQLHLTSVRLPLPDQAVVPSDVDLRLDSAALEFLEHERTQHDATRQKLSEVRLAAEKATSSAAAARTKADKVEAEAKSLRGAVQVLKTEKDDLKEQAKDGWEAKRRVEEEVEDLKADKRRWMREAQDAKDEADRLRRTARSSPSPTVASIPSSVSGDKKDFVILMLRKQVEKLNAQLHDKQNEILKLMTDMSLMHED
ncbi:hypothetical protein JCM8097_006648 [Rhodosporidiobolus ruineniae]